MADSDDEDEPVANPHRRINLRALMGGLLDTEELDGVEDDDDAVDEILDDLADNNALDEDELGDDAGVPVGGNVSLSSKDIERLNSCLVHQKKLEDIRAAYGMASSVRLDVVEIGETPPDSAWIADDNYANMMSETGRVHAAIRKAIDPQTSDEIPELGDGSTSDVPEFIESIRLPRWARIAPKLRASNTVSTLHTSCEPNQERMATNHNSTSFNPNSFAANKIKQDATGLFFRSGSAVVAGARGQIASQNACLKFIRLLQRMDVLPFQPTCKLQNIVSNSTCFPINLDLLAQKYSVYSRYEKDRFPGLVFRFGHGKPWVFIIFPSGNVIGTGFSEWVDANLGWRWLFSNVLVRFKDSTSTIRETAAEKKNRTFNNDDVFSATLRVITAVSRKRTRQQLDNEDELVEYDEELLRAFDKICTADNE